MCVFVCDREWVFMQEILCIYICSWISCLSEYWLSICLFSQSASRWWRLAFYHSYYKYGPVRWFSVLMRTYTFTHTHTNTHSCKRIPCTCVHVYIDRYDQEIDLFSMRPTFGSVLYFGSHQNQHSFIKTQYSDKVHKNMSRLKIKKGCEARIYIQIWLIWV